METKKVDFIVIGGGSGGMAAARQAANNGASVMMFDYVEPSPQGTKWGQGGTCVNVGCIPKKLMHHAAQLRTNYLSDREAFGIGDASAKLEVDYKKMYTTINNYIRKLNFMYGVGLRTAGVTYVNARASLTNNTNVVKYTFKGEDTLVEGKHVLIAVGGRPTLPKMEGIENVITSDDFFWTKKNPGKTLVVGASYIGLECSGIIHALGNEVDICVRSVVLRGFDRECSEKIRIHMTEVGVNFREAGVLPTSIKKDESTGRISVEFSDGAKEIYDTVLYATGRSYDLASIGVPDSINVNGKLCVNEESFETEIPSLYAIGDILKGTMELTPVAVRQGELVADRLFKDSKAKFTMRNVCTTVFTPREYGFVGYSEEKAYEEFGEANVDVYLQEFESLDFSAAHRTKIESLRKDQFDDLQSPNNLCKVVVMRGSEEVLGIHYVGENAGEVIQGFGVAMKTGCLTKAALDACVGIHPTNAEAFCDLRITRRSGEPYCSSGGCGGGKCG